MTIGIDFDNTIIGYDTLFHKVALERGLIEASFPKDKTAIRNHLRACGCEPEWTEMQGIVYGPRISEASVFSGFVDFLRTARTLGFRICIISHKTQYPYAGDRFDLHAAAWKWLDQLGIFAEGLLDRSDVFLESSKAAKLARIAKEGCAAFIDDLPEILSAPEFPANVERFLFDPSSTQSLHGATRCTTWRELGRQLLNSPASRISELQLAALLGSAKPLEGGANNRLYKVKLPDGKDAVLKHYFHDPEDTRNRFGAEYSFYRYAWHKAGIRTIPEPLGWDSAERLGLFALVEGSRLEPWAVTEQHVEQAATFVSALNTKEVLKVATGLAPASEAHLTHRDPFFAVQRRLARLEKVKPIEALDAELMQFVGTAVGPAWVHTARAAEAALREMGISDLDTAVIERCVSPSDFGFHNALSDCKGVLHFLDFEYAGWDDPAKLVCDFFCQPQIPAPQALFQPTAEKIGDNLGLADVGRFVSRCEALLPLFELKWVLLRLNEFLPTGRNRRSFSLGENELRARKARQLEQSRLAFDRMLTPRT